MKMKLLAFILLTATLSAGFAQETGSRPNTATEFVKELSRYREGFAKSSGKNDFIYHSLRSDVNACMLTRATNGQMDIEWITAPVEEQVDNKGAGFVWLAAMDLTPSGHDFDFFFNGVKRFTIRTSEMLDWTASSEDGGMLRFFTMELDQHGDAHGYMALWAPHSWLEPGEGQRIRIVGEAAGSNNWIIVYQAADAAEYLEQSLRYNTWIGLEARNNGKKFDAKVSIPRTSAQTSGPGKGVTLWYSADGAEHAVEARLQGNTLVGSFSFPEKAMGKPFMIRDHTGIMLHVQSFGTAESSVKLLNEAVLQVSQQVDQDNTIRIDARRSYQPRMVTSLTALSESSLSDGNIYLMNSSHQDIAWMDAPEKCVLERDTMLLTPLFGMAAHDPGYRFDIEDALMLREYIQRHPDSKDIIRNLLADGRISCGASYIQPYEEMYSGESLVRQFYLGAGWLEKELDYKANIYWNVDVPGRTLQMPQIMKKAGVEYLMMSRFEKGLYHWYSPDGSFVTAFSPGHYADAFMPLQKSFLDAAQYVSQSSLYWEKYFHDDRSNRVVPLLSDWDMSPAVDYTDMMAQWKTISGQQNGAGRFDPVKLPQFRIASAPEFFDALESSAEKIPAIHGERPALWLYIHGPSHQKAVKASRRGDILLTQAEKFATANALIKGSFRDYPRNDLNSAWEAKIYPDHGWGGKNGDITDHLFKEKYVYSCQEGEQILQKELEDISSRIATNPAKGTPLIVFNSLSWTRSDVVRTTLHFDPGKAFHIALYDHQGKEVPFQYMDSKKYDDGSLQSAGICFIAGKVPSIGFKAFYYRPAAPSPDSSPSAGTGTHFEQKGLRVVNEYYRVEFGKGGLKSIYDRELEVELIDTAKFLAGEVFTMRSVGNGAGEFHAVQQPDMEGFDRTGLYSTTWKLKHDGPVLTSLSMRQPIRNATVVQEVRVYHTLKRIDLYTEIRNWEGILFREYRLALPLNMSAAGKVAYEVPYGVVEVGRDEMAGAAGERYTVPCKDIHPRGIQNWIGAYNRDVSVILSSSVAVADYIDPTDDPVPGPVLQPILFASRQSCHGEGNDYLQTGDHSFHFSITSSAPDWRKGYRSGIQANEELLVVVAPEPYRQAALPEEMSFFGVEAGNVIISALKMAEKGQKVVVRLVEMEGEESSTRLRSFHTLETLHKADLLENPVRKLNPIEDGYLQVGHYAIETYLIE